MAEHRVILASGSPTRARLLTAAGVVFETCLPAIDETAMKESAQDKQGPSLARFLACAKAEDVSRRYDDQALVIGADQVLMCEGRRFDRAGDHAAARRQVLALQGRRHQLHGAVVLFCAGKMAWSCDDTATLTMRKLDEAAVENYLSAGGDALLSTAGSYALEGIGAQLFESVEGDFFTVLGLPLLPLLTALRERGVLAI